MVKHHQKKKKKLSKSKKDEAVRERELRLRNLDQFAGSSDEEEERVEQLQRHDGDDALDSEDDDEYGGKMMEHPSRGGGSRKRSASVGNEADVEESSEDEEDADADEREAEQEDVDASSSLKQKGRRRGGQKKTSSPDDADAVPSDNSEEDGDAYGQDEFGSGPSLMNDDDEMESADEFEGGDTSLSAIASKSAGMAGAMARILGAGTAPAGPAKTANGSSSSKTGSVILSKTTTPLQRLQQKQKTADAALREKRRLRRETNLTAMHVPLSAATSRPLIERGKSAVAAELEEERAHRRVATRGVVALFNAISQHQHKAREEASGENKAVGGDKKKNEEVKVMSKRGFLDMLKTNATKVEGSNGVPGEEKSPCTRTKESGRKSNATERKSGGWNALKDDFMMNSKLKDWDKELTDDEESGASGDDEGAGVGGEINDNWSDDDDDKMRSSSKRQRIKA